ncbi:MAG: PA2169 family four-helix-bundle protein [Pirellulales bacterium]
MKVHSHQSRPDRRDDCQDTVREMVEINIDSFSACQLAADRTQESSLVVFFNALARQRVAQAIALQNVLPDGPDDRLAAKWDRDHVHRPVMDWRKVFAGETSALLREAERGETYIKAKYEAALARTTDSAVWEVLHRQYTAVKETYFRVRDLRAALLRA